MMSYGIQLWFTRIHRTAFLQNGKSHTENTHVTSTRQLTVTHLTDWWPGLCLDQSRNCLVHKLLFLKKKVDRMPYFNFYMWNLQTCKCKEICLSVDCICTVNRFAVMVLYRFSLLWMAKNMSKLQCYDFISAIKVQKNY